MGRRRGRTLKPKECKYCLHLFSDTLRYLSHLKSHEKRIKPFWYKKSRVSQKLKEWKKHSPEHSYEEPSLKENAHEEPSRKENSYEAPSQETLLHNTLESIKHHTINGIFRKPAPDSSDTLLHLGTNFKTDDKTESIVSRIVSVCMNVESQVTASNLIGAPFKCRYCGIRFAYAEAKETHELVHKHSTGRIYKCRYCQAAFTRHAVKKKHELSHGFKCDFCPKRFFLLASKTSHELEHKIHQCKICGERFADYVDKQLHEMVHGRAYKCKFCDKAFYRLDSKEAHERIHIAHAQSGSRLKCRYCDKMFTEDEMKIHERCHEEAGTSNNIYYKPPTKVRELIATKPIVPLVNMVKKLDKIEAEPEPNENRKPEDVNGANVIYVPGSAYVPTINIQCRFCDKIFTADEMEIHERCHMEEGTIYTRPQRLKLPDTKLPAPQRLKLPDTKIPVVTEDGSTERSQCGPHNGDRKKRRTKQAPRKLVAICSEMDEEGYLNY